MKRIPTVLKRHPRRQNRQMVTLKRKLKDCLLHKSLPTTMNENINKKQKWTKAEYKEIMNCYFYTIETTGTKNQDKTYELWKSRNNNSTRKSLTSQKLANQRRFIEKSGKLSEQEILEIKAKVINKLHQNNHNQNIHCNSMESNTSQTVDPEHSQGEHIVENKEKNLETTVNQSV